MPKITIDRADRRLPTSTGTPFAQTPQVAQQGLGLQQAGETLIDIGAKLDAERQKAETIDYITTAQVQVADRLLKTRQEMEERFEGNYKGFADNYLAQADEIYTEFINNAPNSDARQRLQVQFAAQRSAAGPRIKAFEDAQLVDQYIMNAEENINQLANIVADDPDGALALQSQVQEIIKGMDPLLSGSEQQKFEQSVNRQMSYAMLQGLIFKGDLDRAASVLKSPAITKHLNASDRKSFENAIQAKGNSLQREAEKAEKAAIDLKRDQLLSLATVGREVSPGEYQPVPTNEAIQEILNSDLPAFGTGSKAQLLNMVEKGQGKEDEIIFNTLLDRIYSGEAVSNDEILSHVGPDGLSYRQFKNLQSERDELGGTTFREAMKGVKSLITSSSLIGKDALGDLNYMKMTNEAREEYRKALVKAQKGEISYSPDDLFTPGKPNYILDKLVAKYHKSMTDISSDNIKIMTGKLEEVLNEKPTLTPQELDKLQDDRMKQDALDFLRKNIDQLGPK